MIQNLSVEPSAGMDENILHLITQVEDRLTVTQAADNQAKIWSVVTKTKLSKYTVGAIIFIGIIVGANYLDTNLNRGSVAWASIAEQVRQAEALIYHVVSINEGSVTVGKQSFDIPDMEMNFIISKQYGVKMEIFTTVNDKTTEQVAYMLPSENHMLIVMPEQKKYMRFSFNDDMALRMRKHQEENDPRQMFIGAFESNHVKLGRKIIDGKEVEGIETTDPRYSGGRSDDIVARIWVDVKTGWPALMEIDMVIDSPASKGSYQSHTVIDGFQWDLQIDPDEFLPDIPSDYSEMPTIQTPSTDAARAIKGFQLLVGLIGRYPDSLESMSIAKIIMDANMNLSKQLSQIGEEVLANKDSLPADEVIRLLQRRLEGTLSGRFPNELMQLCIDKAIVKAKRKLGLIDTNADSEDAETDTTPQILQLTRQWMMSMQSISTFHMLLIQQNKGPHYYGNGVKPGDSDHVLMLWKGDDGAYEVIYGDLRWALIPVDQLPELEESNQNL